MPRNSSGTYTQPSGTSATTETSISSSAYNTLIADIGTEITNSLPRAGEAAMTGNLNIGGNNVQNMADGVNPTDACTVEQLNNIVGQSQFPSGTVLPFATPGGAAPVGWTKVVTYNDVAMRIVSGTPGSSTGGIAFSTLFASGTVTGFHALTVNEMPAHNHSINDPGHAHTVSQTNSGNVGFSGLGGNSANNGTFATTTGTGFTGISINNNGGGNPHSHTMALNVNYVDFILASKN